MSDPDTHKHKAILQGYRRGQGLEDALPDVRRALEAAESDEELAAWLEREQAFDTALSDKLARIQPPADLKERLLAAGATADSTVLIEPPAAWWRRPALISLAASALVLLTLAVFLLEPQEIRADELLEDFTEDMVAHCSQKRPPHQRSSDWNDVSTFLRDNNHPYPQMDVLPARVRQTQPRGAKILHWRDHPVGVVKLDDPTWSYLYIIRRQPFFGAKDLSAPHSREHSGHRVFMWNDADHVYILVVDGPGADFFHLQ